MILWITVEMEQLLLSESNDLSKENEVEPCWPWGGVPLTPVRRHKGSGSGGYAYHIFLHAAKELFPDVPANLEFRAVR